MIPDWGWRGIGHVGNLSAGIADPITLGATRAIRRRNGTDNFVNPCSNAYRAGEVLGVVLPMFTGAGELEGATLFEEGFLPFTKGNFRPNLAKLTGEMPVGSHAHHVFPKATEFADFFLDAEINVHNPQYGSWWEIHSHLQNASRYNALWREFFVEARSQQEILDFGRQIMASYGLPVHY